MKWKLINPEGATLQPRHGHRATALPDGFVVYGGGNRGICNQFIIYNSFQNKNIVPMLSGKICPGVAAFGMATQSDKLIIFGGMLEYQIYTNFLYTLDLKTWHWNRISNAIGEPPRARIGHSFTTIDDHKIFMFGGIVNIHPNPHKQLSPRFTRNLYILHTHNKNKFAWEEVLSENGPCGRESHSAVFHKNKTLDKGYLIIFGGMNGERLNDLWFLDVDQLVWLQFVTHGIPPEPRSLHTATLIDNKMFIFGGWQNDTSKLVENDNINFCATNSLTSLNIDTLEWENVKINHPLPPPRAGHCAVAINNRIYLTSGRSVHTYIKDQPQPCLDDFWYLELSPPPKIEKIEMIQCTTKSIELKWNRYGNANCYLIEICRAPEMTKIASIRLVANIAQTSMAEKRKLEGSTAKKVIIINPLTKLQQLDGSNDEEFNISDESLTQDFDKIKKKSPCVITASTTDSSWCTVGVFKNNTCSIDGYFSFTFPKDFNDEMCPQTVMMPKIELQSNSMYVFRIAGINSCGIGEFSKLAPFKTLAEGLPSPPSNIKFIPMVKDLRLCWTPPPLTDRVKEFYTYIGEKINDKVNFTRIYMGNQPTCTIAFELLKKNEYHMTSTENPSKHFIFRVRAANENGMGPFLQVTYNMNIE